VELQPIGVIRTPHKTLEQMPIQPIGATGVPGRIELDPDLADGLCDLAGFSHIIVLYHFHRAGKPALTVIPFLDNKPRGVFATRAPSRPNPIGLSILKLNSLQGAVLNVENVDILDGTPLLDIKPYAPVFVHQPEPIRSGWLERSGDAVKVARSDQRFIKKS